MNKRQKEVIKTQLNSEQETLDELKEVYEQALKDCEEKIQELSERTDMENIQSIVYQKRYQEAIKAQLEGILSNLQSNSYATISDYLTRCYRDGYTGVMYDLMGQGIPFIVPIDQEAVTRAIQLDSKLSKSLYDRLGEDVNALKKAVRAEVSRGIANGSTWNQVAGQLARNMKNTPFQRAYNNSIRIARTEGHRIQIQSALDAMYVAKSNGADVVKQWDSTLDGKTRPTHRELDGKLAEVEEKFKYSGGEVLAPMMFGNPAEDCNCRCALLQRARWALDEDELQTLKERAEYFGLDKTEDFEEYQRKYLGISEKDIANDAENDKIELTRKGINGRDGLKFISDKTFDDLTIKARKSGATILRGTMDIEKHLDEVGAAASIIGDTLLFRKDVCISEVLEETYHYEQNLKKLNDDKPEPLRSILNEIDAKEYLIANADKYGIPRNERELTENQLLEYKKQLERYKKEGKP